MNGQIVLLKDAFARYKVYFFIILIKIVNEFTTQKQSGSL